MTTFTAGKYDIAVIGAGHAGTEAALAAARLGASVILLTINLDSVGNMPCNPCIGGTAKGQLVREIDALGGEMAKAADATFIQSRMLCRSKGPAIRSPRVQSDRRRYQDYIKKTLEQTENLHLRQAEVIEILTDGEKVSGVVTATGAIFEAKAVIIASGTYLHGKIFIGEGIFDGGPDGMQAAKGLSASIEKLGIKLRRFKTGTPCRVLKSSLDLSQMEVQEGDEPVMPLSFETTEKLENKAVCHLVYTTPETHKIILDNLHRSPLFGGAIVGVGPRYCPSIEDKIVRFKDKERHQLFVEPMGEETGEMYIQGMSSSLPEDVQLLMVRSLKGFENAHIMRPAYAIEYDCIDPLDLLPTLECKALSGLYGAGQFCGSSGYEEAAAQGLVAGINAVRKIKGRPPFILGRETSYIGTLVDDLVTKGTDEPYRMMTSRSEYRLLLRQDNADLRLTEIGREIGLISDLRYQNFLRRKEQIEVEVARIKSTSIPPSEGLAALLEAAGGAATTQAVKLADLLRRPKVGYEALAPFDATRPPLPIDVWEEAEIEIKYEGYIKKQLDEIERAKKLESVEIPHNFDYEKTEGIRLEARSKLSKIRPTTVGQAARISGVSPADIAVLLVALG